jgi:transcriptional antiterminator
MMIQSIINQIPYQKFDYQTLLDALSDYAYPRDKITDLIRKRIIIRVKKGIYIFGNEYRKRPFSRELLLHFMEVQHCAPCMGLTVFQKKWIFRS